MRLIKMLFHPFIDGVFMPFRIWCKAGIRIRTGARVKLDGRLTLGNPDKRAAVVSLMPVNLYFGSKSSITFGHSISFGPGVNIIVKDGAVLRIGNSTYFTSDMHLEAVNDIRIGSNCAISWGVTIIDDDHHELLSTVSSQKLRAVTIGDQVWIGCNATILKGTSIGNNSVVAAGSVVKGIFPPNSLIAGNPARVIRENIDWK
jgi:acetyltransferase-like isoleucine patch superfamily enzyme